MGRKRGEVRRLAKRLLRPFWREPDFYIGGKVNPYLVRWWVIPRNRFFNVYLHKFLRDDDDRALHDHPWISLSFILRGGYIEHTPGDVVIRWADPHRLYPSRPAPTILQGEHGN